MRVLFAVSNEKMSESIIRQYQKEYKQIISCKNVYYFNAILKELQRDKGYDRIVISEDLEQYVNTDYEQMDKFIFDRLDSISDEASNLNGEDIPIILICTERRNKSEQILVKLFGIGIYNAIIGKDRSVNEVCRLLNRPRSKKEAKIYYRIDSEDVTYEKDDENDVSELEIQNILAHYKKLGNDEERYVESFNSIASQYNDEQLKIISKFLPLGVKAVLEEKSEKYQQINSYNNKISDKVRISKKQEKKGTSEILLKNVQTKNIDEPVVVPSSIDANKKKKIISKTSNPEKEYIKTIEKENPVEEIKQEEFQDVKELRDIDETKIVEETQTTEESPVIDVEMPTETQVAQPVKRGRGRPRKVVQEPIEPKPKRKRGRPRKVVEEDVMLKNSNDYEEDGILPGFENVNINDEIENNNLEEITSSQFEEEVILPGFEDDNENDTILPNVESEEEKSLSSIEEDEEETILPGFEGEEEEKVEQPRFNNIQEENYFGISKKTTEKQNEELDMSQLLLPEQKIVAFVGTSKNGTSFLINNVAELLSANGIDTAILDLTHNRNAYYIYTKNEEELRNQSNYIMKNLKIGKTTGIQEHKNLTVYTTAFEDDEDIQDVEPIVKTLVKNHKVVLMDCDFSTPMRYFKYAQEIYLVQSMDILTIQPLTVFLRQLADKNLLDESKIRVILNKFIRTREINEALLIGGMSIYNDAGMTVRKELFDRRSVPYVTVPFELKTYLRYLDGIVVCDVSLKGYSKEFMQSLKRLTSMVYQENDDKKAKKYAPPSVKNNMNMNTNQGY